MLRNRRLSIPLCFILIFLRHKSSAYHKFLDEKYLKLRMLYMFYFYKTDARLILWLIKDYTALIQLHHLSAIKWITTFNL
jgi:hypothetical protein